MQFDQLRFAVGSPVGGTDKHQHGALRSHDGIQVPRFSVLIAQAEAGYVLTHLRSELGYVDLFYRRPLCWQRNVRKSSRDQCGANDNPRPGHIVSLSLYRYLRDSKLKRHSMAYDVPGDLAEKAEIMREFGRRRAAGEPVPEELYFKHVNATNDRYATGPDPGQRIPDFTLPDQNGVLRSLADLTGPNGLLLVFHRSADW